MEAREPSERQARGNMGAWSKPRVAQEAKGGHVYREPSSYPRTARPPQQPDNVTGKHRNCEGSLAVRTTDSQDRPAFAPQTLAVQGARDREPGPDAPEQGREGHAGTGSRPQKASRGLTAHILVQGDAQSLKCTRACPPQQPATTAVMRRLLTTGRNKGWGRGQRPWLAPPWGPQPGVCGCYRGCAT